LALAVPFVLREVVMAEFKDLSPYRYWGAGEDSLNVGWLEDTSFRKGSAPEGFLEALAEFCHILVTPARGFHACLFCGSSLPSLFPRRKDHVKLGYAEIRVFGAKSVYAAPNLIYHYILKHDYLPPKRFVNAVLRGPRPPSKAYMKRLERLRVRYWVFREDGEVEYH
jgi:hypothetical protein